MFIDFYDDPAGSVLRKHIPEADQLPEFIKTAARVPDDSVYPDDAFALVMVDQGHKMRKFACVDKGNTALSVIYLLENHDRLPEEAVKVAAANLCAACDSFDLDTPMGLRKLSMDIPGTQSVSDLAGSVRNPKPRIFPRGTGKAALIGGTTLAALGAIGYANRHKKKKLASIGTAAKLGMTGMIGNDAVKSGMNKHQQMMGGQNMVGGQPKVADMTGSEEMPLSVDKERADKSLRSKTASLYVDITGKTAAPKVKVASYQRHCLGDKYPIDSLGQVEQAVDWFEKHAEALHPGDRREYCINLKARADEMGIQVTRDIGKYASESFAPRGELEVAVQTRRQYWRDGEAEAGLLDGLMAKHASAGPEVFCEALKQFDEATGLDHMWDKGIYDPWYSTYGMQKTAEWSFSSHGDRITAPQLKEIGFQAMSRKFGEDMAAGFAKNPTQIFDSLPLDTKRIIMRMANDPQPTFLP